MEGGEGARALHVKMSGSCCLCHSLFIAIKK